jgi:hypothetical protein
MGDIQKIIVIWGCLTVGVLQTYDICGKIISNHQIAPHFQRIPARPGPTSMVHFPVTIRKVVAVTECMAPNVFQVHVPMMHQSAAF